MQNNSFSALYARPKQYKSASEQFFSALFRSCGLPICILVTAAEQSERGEKSHCCASNGQKCAQGEEGKGERCASEARMFVRTRKFPQEKEWETRRKRGRTEERIDARMRDFRMISHCPAVGNSIHIGKAEQGERGEKSHCCARSNFRSPSRNQKHPPSRVFLVLCRSIIRA